MKILVISDLHELTANLSRVLRSHPDADAAIFLGDGAVYFLSQREKYPNTAFFAVSGNCDIGASSFGIRAAEEITLEGKRIFFCHGHTYGVKGGLGNLISAARAREADIVLFGHTHLPLERYIPADEDGRALYLVNPGTLGGRSENGHTYAVITIKDDNVLISHGRIAGRRE